MAVTCLVVDDDPVQRRLLEAALNRLGHRVLTAGDGEEGLAVLDGPRGTEVGLMLVDLVMPGLDGLGLLGRLKERGSTVPVIVQTSQGSIDTVISAMRAGAVDFCVKPVGAERLKVSVENALRLTTMEKAVRQVERKAASRLAFDDLIGAAPAMERAVALGRRAAASNIPVLIEGESGVGKELFARAIQGESKRSGKPFVTVNCGALPENLAESILFGHEKGAFTGATARHAGKFREADGGTLFLDEVGELTPEIQVKLLRALQEGEVDPVGGAKPVRCDFRLISATNRDLIAAVRDGRFREDLYYRLNVFPVALPPLRRRREDIPALAAHFAARFALEEGRRGLSGLTPAAERLLLAQEWPGNVRQLENALFRAVVLAQGEKIGVEDFPQLQPAGEASMEVDAVATLAPPPCAPASSPLVGQDGAPIALEVLERMAVENAIEHHGGRMTQVARSLGIGRSTLYRKLHEYGLGVAAEA